MSSQDEPRAKRPRATVDFALCIKCQSRTKETLSQPSQHDISVNKEQSSYNKFLSAVHVRASYGNSDFVVLSERLQGITASDLAEHHAKWHRSCYSLVTNKDHLKRDENRYTQACAAADVSHLKRKRGRPSASCAKPPDDSETPRCTRSQISTYDKAKCFFCQGKHPGTVHACSTTNVGSQICDIVQNSNNSEWKVNYANVLSEHDALSRDIMYHKQCLAKHWQQHKHVIDDSIPESSTASTDNMTENMENTVQYIAAEIEFFAELEESVNNGDFIPIDKANNDYVSKMKQHNIEYVSVYTPKHERKMLREKIQQNIPGVQFTTPKQKNKPVLIHSVHAQRTAIEAEANKSDLRDDIKKIFEASKLLRKAIENAKKDPWVFKGSLTDEQSGVPQELNNMLLWMLKGVHTVKTEARAQALDRSASFLAQQILQAHKSDRQVLYAPKTTNTPGFRSTVETPLTLGMSLYCDHQFRSQKLADVLSKSGIGVPYHRTKQCITQIAEGVQQNMDEHAGNYIPPGLHRQKRLRFSVDNIDAQVDTPDGKNSFHATAMAVYQREPPMDSGSCGPVVPVAKPAIPTQNTTSRSLKDVPSTVVPLVASKITGNPKPSSSVHYENFQLGASDHELHKYELDDIGWLLIRHYHRPLTNSQEMLERQDHELQPVPLWSAYNSIRYGSGGHAVLNRDKVHVLPLINSPAHEWPTLTTALTQLYNLNKEVCENPTDPILVWLDMDLYKRVQKISILDPHLAGKFIACPGPFHIVLCALRCLGAMLDSSGLDEAWVEAGLYSSVTTAQILNGKHHNRALNAHQITLQVLFDLWIDAFFQEKPTMQEELTTAIENVRQACRSNDGIGVAHTQLIEAMENLQFMTHLTEFDKKNEKYPMYRWARMYMGQVCNLLQYLRGTRDGNWELNLVSLEQMCVYFFAFNRHDYAQNIPGHIAQMSELQQSHPDIWRDFKSGEFTITKNSVPFTSIGPDQAQEHVNRVHKGDGAISGLTTDPQALLKYCLSSPELTRLAGETEHMLNIGDPGTKKHHQHSAAKNSRQEEAVKKLKSVVVRSNPFDTNEKDDGSELKLVNIITKQVMPNAIEKDVLDMEARGKNALGLFINDRIAGNMNMWDKMPKLKFLSWKDGCKTIKLKASSEVMNLKATNSLFVRLLLIAKSSRDLELEDIVSKYEFSHFNATLMKRDGSLLPSSSKSLLAHELESIAPVSPTESDESTPENIFNEGTSPSPSQTIIIDGMAVVHELHVHKAHIKNCKDLSAFFVRAADSKSLGYSEAYILFDDYITTSLKDHTRQLRTAGRSSDRGYKVEDSTPIKDLKSFLNSKETKASLTLYLAQKAVHCCKVPTVSHTHKGVFSAHESSVRIRSTHVEADTLIMLYAVALSGLGVTVHIYSSDTDVLVLALRRVPELSADSIVITGTGDKRRNVKLKPIYDALGAEKAAALPGFHALTGADITGHIQGKGKPTCFKALLKAPDHVVRALADLGVGSYPSDLVLSGCEQFLCQLFKPNVTTAKQARWIMFKQLKPNQGVEKLFPTQGAIIQHILRAHYQAHIWAQDSVAEPAVLDPLGLGWSKDINGQYIPTVSNLPPAPEAVVELVKCNCVASKCSARCSCKTHNMACTELCKCEAVEGACTNVLAHMSLSDDDTDEESDIDD